MQTIWAFCSFISNCSLSMARAKFPPPRHFVIIFLLTTIVAHLQVKSQFMEVSPYIEYKGIIKAIYFSLFSYGLSLTAEFDWEITSQALLSIIKGFSLFSGYLLVILHIILLQPEFGWFTFILWVISLIGALLWSIQKIKELCQCFNDTLQGINEKIANYLQNIKEKAKNYLHGEKAMP